MSMSDPLGDMLTRIRNALMRGKSSCSTPASKLRARVLDVLQSEGYIRGYSEVEYEKGKSEFQIDCVHATRRDGRSRSTDPEYWR